MEYWKWTRPVGEQDPALQLSIIQVILKIPAVMFELQLLNLG